MRLRGKLIATLSLLSLATVVCMVAILDLSEKRHLSRQIEEQQLSSLNKFGRVSAESIIDDNDILRMAYIKTFMESSSPGSIAYALLLDAGGRVLMHSDFHRGDYSSRRTEPAAPELVAAVKARGLLRQAVSAGARRLAVISAPVLAGQKRLGTAIIAYDQDVVDGSVRAVQRESLARFMGAGGGAVALSLVLACLLALTLTRPIERLRQGARAIGAGNLATRLALERRDELGDLAAEFNSMAQKLAELDELKEEFLAQITHDLRNPLSAIMGHCDLLAEGVLGPLSAKQAESVEICRRNQQFLADLIDNILDITKLKAGKMPLEPASLAFNKLVASVIEALKVRADEYKIAVTCDAVPPDAVVYADAQALKRVLINLLSNALKFTPSGGRVALGWARLPSGACQITVADTGIGIPAEKLPRMFEKFMQVAETRDKVRPGKGTGLGLVICKQFIEAHGGTISVASQYKSGTTFTIALPAAPGIKA